MTLRTHQRCLLSTLALLLLTFFSMVSAHEQSSNNYTMPKDVLSNGGDKSNSSSYRMVATVGQHATRKGTANGNVLYSGFYVPRTRSPKSNSACGGVTEGLVACYPFDGNANDASGNGNHGVENGTIEYVEGKIEQAVKLNGTLSYIRVSNPNKNFDKQYTITGWFLTKGRGMPILAKYSWNGYSRGFAISTTTPNGSGSPFSGSTLFPVAMYNESWNPKKFPSYTLPINEFKYVSAIYNEGHTKLYINGVLVGESTVQHRGTLDNPYDILIGAYWHNHGKSIAHARTFDGSIDDLRIYNRALTESEIKQLYNGKEEPCEPELSIEPLYRVLQWWQIQTLFELQDKADCGDMNWTSKANQPWISVSPTSGTDDATLKAMMPPSFWFNVGTFTTTVPNAIGSPANNLVIQPGLWWWWRYWVMRLISGTIHPNQAIPHIIGINRMMWGPMIFKVTWPGSDLDLRITTPSGKTLTQDSPEVLKVHQGDTEEYWVVESQEQGDWQVEVVAIEVDAEGEDYQLEIIANERTEPPTEDSDGDGLADEWEEYFFGDLSQEGTDDSDGDGVSNLREFQQGINPTSSDTDGDGKLDGFADEITPTPCQVYAVDDKGLNNSQFFTINPETLEVKTLGDGLPSYDIEALDIDKNDVLYAASGDDSNKSGHLYIVNTQTGVLTDMGATGFAEIEGLSFHPVNDKLYGFAKGDGLIEIDSATAASLLIIPTDVQVEDLTWNNDGSLLYAAQDTNLWVYDGESLQKACDLPGHTEALEMLPDNHLLIGMHGNKNILDFQIMNLATCDLVQGINIPTKYNDVEGIAYPAETCTKD